MILGCCFLSQEFVTGDDFVAGHSLNVLNVNYRYLSDCLRLLTIPGYRFLMFNSTSVDAKARFNFIFLLFFIVISALT